MIPYTNADADADDSDETSSCMNALDDWITSQKHTIYDANIKSPDNTTGVLTSYTDMLEERAFHLAAAITKEDFQKLREFDWPQELVECLRDPYIKTLILDEINQWFIRFPYVKSRIHLKELETQYKGINS